MAAAACLTSTHPVALAATTTPITSLIGTKSSINQSAAVSINNSNSTKSSQSQVKAQQQQLPLTSQQLHSTPIPSRKSSLLFTRSQDQTALKLENTTLSNQYNIDTSNINTSSDPSSSVVSISPDSAFMQLNQNHHLVNNSNNISVSANNSIQHQQSQFTISLPNSLGESSKSVVRGVSNGSPATTFGAKVMDYTEMREVIKHVVQEAIVEYEDEEMAFCRSLAASLRHLDRSKKDVAKLELQHVIVRHTNPNYCQNISNFTLNNNNNNISQLQQQTEEERSNVSAVSSLMSVSSGVDCGNSGSDSGCGIRLNSINNNNNNSSTVGSSSFSSTSVNTIMSSSSKANSAIGGDGDNNKSKKI